MPRRSIAVVLAEALVLDRDDRLPHRIGEIVVVLDQRPRSRPAQHGEDSCLPFES